MELRQKVSYEIIFSKEDVKTINNFRIFLRKLFLKTTALENNNTENNRFYMVGKGEKENGDEIKKTTSDWLKRIASYGNVEDYQPFCAAVSDALEQSFDPADTIYFLEKLLGYMIDETKKDYEE